MVCTISMEKATEQELSLMVKVTEGGVKQNDSKERYQTVNHQNVGGNGAKDANMELKEKDYHHRYGDKNERFEYVVEFIRVEGESLEIKKVEYEKLHRSYEQKSIYKQQESKSTVRDE